MEMEIKHLELTERDFRLLVDALDHLPQKDVASDIMSSLLTGMLKKEGQEMTEFERKREQEMKKKELEKEVLKEEIKILQGKLLMFKRFLIQQDALKQVDDILNQGR